MARSKSVPVLVGGPFRKRASRAKPVRCACGSTHDVLLVDAGIKCKGCGWWTNRPEVGEAQHPCSHCGGELVRFLYLPQCSKCRQVILFPSSA